MKDVSISSSLLIGVDWGETWYLSFDVILCRPRDLISYDALNCKTDAFCESKLLYLALINRAGGLHGRILTEVVSTDRTRWGLYTQPRSRFSHADRLSSVNKMFIIWQKQEQCNCFLLTDILLANSDEPNLILPKFARPLYLFFSSVFWHLQK